MMNESQKTRNADSRRPAGVIGFFRKPDDLIAAMEKVRGANYRYFDAFTPYPVHGLDTAQGLKRSFLPFITFAAGLTGCTLGFLLQYWTMVIDWPVIVGGKPFNSWPAFVPVMFECTILFAGLATVGGMFFINRLPNVQRKGFDPRLTNDRFAIVIESEPEEGDEEEEDELEAARKKKGKDFKPFDEREVADFLKKAGAEEVKSVYAEGWF